LDIKAYLGAQKEQISRRTRQVKDFSVFDFSYIPEEPVMRDECKTLIDEMLHFDVSGIPNHQAIVGSRGSGKTLMVKYLQHVIPESTGLNVT